MENQTTSRKAKWFAALVVAMAIGMMVQTAAIGYLALHPGSSTPPSVTEAAASNSGSWHLMNPATPAKPGTAVQTQPQTNLTTPFNAQQWDPFKEMRQMQERMDAMFNNAFGRMGESPQFSALTKGFAASPSMDVTENDHQYVVRVDLPGADESKINVSLEGQQLTIRAERSGELGGKNPGTMLRSERYMGAYERSMTLPKPVVDSSLKQHYEKGVLTITIDKQK